MNDDVSPQAPVTTAATERQRLQLLNDASSHGQYLWSNRDVENSLLWFHSSSSLSTKERTTEEKKEDNDKQMEEGYEFLRRLLHSPGIIFERPSFKRSKRKRVGSSLESLNNDHLVTKRGDEIKSSSPLQSILKGYYRLMSSYLITCNSNDDTRSLSECMEDDTVTTTTTTMTFTERIQHAASVASSRLLTDLWSIIHARSHNVDIYRAYSNVVDQDQDQERQSKEKRGMDRQGARMMISFDEYITFPTTCARVSYASCLYDRMIFLCHENCGDSTTVGVNNDDDNDNHLPIQLFIFLHKLLGLAATNAKICEVIMLILLEPKSRSEVDHRDDSVLETENVEIACTRPPLSTLVQMILRSNITKEESTMEHTIISMKIKVWWSLPSPLMCAISHGYLSIATDYIQYWIKTAVLGHIELYSNVAARVCSDDENEDMDDLFGHAISRIIQFRSTSETLNILSRHALHSIKEDGPLGVLLENYEREDKGEDTAFVISLAWKAIHRALQ